MAKQALEIEKLKEPAKENCNRYPCKNAHKGCVKITDNTHNKEVHEYYCKYNKTDKNGSPAPLSQNQKKKEQKKKSAERKKAALPYERPPAPPAASATRPSVLQRVDPNNTSRRK